VPASRLSTRPIDARGPRVVAAPPAGIAWHGALMASAFFGTLISLERAVALGRLWAYAAPLACGAGGVALVGDAAACPSLLAGEGTGLGMLEAYVLAGELHRADGDCARALAAYESRLQTFVSGKQKGAIWFRGFFAPQTNAGLMVRNLAVRAFSLPWLGKPFWARSLHDDFTLPDYQMD